MTEYGCKVCRILDERDMERYERRLVDQWQADAAQRKGYRQLAEWLNTMMLRREMDRAGLSTLGNEPESKYERLTGDDETVAAEVRRDLRGEGIDVDELDADFVSYGVVRTHLTDCLGLERDVEATDWEADAIEYTREHATGKLEDAVRSLVSKGNLAACGDVEVHVSFEVECEECHTQVPVERALRRGYITRDALEE
ncbi:rod-determining factor RdfA [Halorientalis halophila]|uniref:rod-determining factor RdfA n=1 Tax=Halorientalis halophila TaxID=3108499 RepID=UPI00300AF23D